MQHAYHCADKNVLCIKNVYIYIFILFMIFYLYAVCAASSLDDPILFQLETPQAGT